MPGRKGSQAARVHGLVRAGVAEPERGSDGWQWLGSGQQGFMIPHWTPDPEMGPDKNLHLSLNDSSSHPRSGTALRCLALISSACRHRPLVGHPSPFPQGGWGGRGEAAARASHPARVPDVPPVHPGVPQLLAMVQHQVPGARLVKDLPHELVLVLP